MAHTHGETIIEVKNLIKNFKTGDVITRVLKGISFTVRRGEWIAIIGRSGAGKSTLMYQMSLLDDPTDGEIFILGREAHSLSEKDKMALRLVEFGFVFQDYALMPELTATENIVLPLIMEKVPLALAEAKAIDALKKVGLEDRLRSLPAQLSGGEQQRVSIARAIAERPQILFADEPTANLDRESSNKVMEIFRDLHEEGRQTIIMVTHEEEYTKVADRVITIDDGKIVAVREHSAAMS